MKMFHVEHKNSHQLLAFSYQLKAICIFILFTITLFAHGQYVTLTGKLQGANGLPAANDILSFTPTQNFYVAGVTPLVVVQATAQCTTTIDGTVVGVPNPLNPPQLSAVYNGTTLPSGTYYVEISWYDAFGNVTLPSTEAIISLDSNGELLVNAPISGMPDNAVGAKVYIGISSGGETLQGSVVSIGTFTQSTPLVTGAAPPSTNTTLCQIIANDAGWPTGTGYMVGLTTPAGATMPGYPMQWQLLGPGSTINLGNGLPLYNGIVTYPSPILASPYNHGTQSISGPLSLTNYNLTNVGKLGVGTNVPAWGVDVEGAGLSSYINANGGYLINGSGGAAGQVPCSDGTAIDQFCSAAGYYQTIALNGTALTQRATLNFVAPFITATDSSSPARTTLTFNATGTENKIVTSAGAGTNGQYAIWDAFGGLMGVTVPAGFTYGSNSNGYWAKDPTGHIRQWGTLAGSPSTGSVVTFPISFTNASSISVNATSITTSGSGIAFISIQSGTVSATQFVIEVGAESSSNGLYWSADGY